MKKARVKILLAILATLVLLITAFTISTLADSKYAELTFFQNGSSYKKAVALGDEFTLPTPNPQVGGTVYGWFDSEGNFYECGAKIKPDKNTTLYCAEGGEFALNGSLALYCQKGYSYVKLKSNITLDSSIALPDNSILYIDLNGNSISISTEAKINESNGEEIPHGAFVGKDSGIIFANSSAQKSTITHTADGNTSFSMNSLVSVSPSSSAQNLSLVVKENIEIIDNMNLVSVETDISHIDGALKISLYGSVECERLLRVNGIENARVTLYDGSSLTTHGEFVFEDITSATNTLATLKIYDAKVTLDGIGFIKKPERIIPLIYGGSYSRDIASLFPNGNYVFELNEETSLYDFKECTHTGPLIEHAYVCAHPCTLNHTHCQTGCSAMHEHCQCVLDHDHYYCDTPRELKHLCNYCNLEFLVAYPAGVGHSLRIELVQAPVNTKEETKEGKYRTYCTRGDFERIEYAFPNPDSVYVTVKYMDGEEEKSIRVHSQDLFSFDEKEKTKIISYSADNVYYYDEAGERITIPAEDIFYVEVPSGTTALYGEMKNANNTPTEVGVFVNDYYLKEVALPASIESIDSYAFYNMASIEKITGIEYITGSIGTKAFMQPANTRLSFDHLEINAREIGSNAFRNIVIKQTLTIGENVTKISDYAFALDDEIKVTPENTIKEIFVAGNENVDGVTLNQIKTGMGNYHQFSSLPIVFTGHDYILETIPATCISYGHDLHTCSRNCGSVYIDNFVEHYAEHAFVEHIVPSTCQSYGFKGVKCTVEGCGFSVKDEVGGDLPIDKDNHTYAAGVVKYAIDADGYFCVDPYYTLRKCGCGKIEENTKSVIEFTYTGNGEKTSWTFYLLDDNTILLYDGDKKITNKNLGSMSIADGAFSTLTYNGFFFTLTKQEGNQGELAGIYTASNTSGISFELTATVGNAYQAFIPDDNATHNFKEDVIIAPTCDYGKMSRLCLDCRYKPADTILDPVSNHSNEKIVLQEATCSTIESGKYVCSVCKYEVAYRFEGSYDTTKHAKKVNDEGVVVAEPSSQNAGLRKFTCKDCGGDIFEEIPKIDDTISFKIPILNIEINTDKRTFTTTLIIIFASIPLIAGIILTFVFTFTKKKSKAAGYKFRFNTLKKSGEHSNKSVAEQLAEMELVDELPPDVELNEDGKRDDEAAWTAYVDAINNDYTRTIELNMAKEAEGEDTSVDEVTPDSNGNAWEAYVAAINKDYEETMELNLNEANKEEKSLADLMDDTIVDMSLSSFAQQGETSSEEEETFDLGTPSEDESFDLGDSDEESFSL